MSHNSSTDTDHHDESTAEQSRKAGVFDLETDGIESEMDMLTRNDRLDAIAALLQTWAHRILSATEQEGGGEQHRAPNSTNNDSQF